VKSHNRRNGEGTLQETAVRGALDEEGGELSERGIIVRTSLPVLIMY
jgi:hypothetical protein